MNAAPRRKWITVVILTCLLCLTAGGGYYYRLRSLTPRPPPIATDGLETEVVEAIGKARSAVVDQPTSANAWGELGIVLFAHELHAEARPCFEQAEALDAADVRWPYYRALLHGESDDALPALERAVQRAGREYAPRLRYAEALFRQEKFDEAQPRYLETLVWQSNLPRAYLGLGRIAAHRGDFKEATRYLHSLLNDPTCRHAARLALADICVRCGEPAQAEGHVRVAQQLPPDLPWRDNFVDEMESRKVGLKAQLQLANALVNRQQYDRALATLQSITRKYPESATAHANLGRMMLTRGEPAAAEPPLREAIRLEPKNVTAHFLLGVAHLQRNDAKNAETQFRRAIELKPDDAQSRLHLGHCRKKQNDPKGAMDSYRDAIRFGPNLFEAHLAAGELAIEGGDKKAAATFLEDALCLKPDDKKARQLQLRLRAN